MAITSSVHNIHHCCDINQPPLHFVIKICYCNQIDVGYVLAIEQRMYIKCVIGAFSVRCIVLVLLHDENDIVLCHLVEVWLQ